MPTAPPRMFPTFGFADTLGDIGGLNHGSGLIELASNPYAAMPSLHAADALIVGITLSVVCRNRFAKIAWAIWPVWVWFSVMATANHFWLDVVAGVGVALVALAVIHRRAASREHACTRAVRSRLAQGAYTAGARSLATQSMVGLARSRVTPNALTASGVLLCAAASVLVYFEYRNEISSSGSAPPSSCSARSSTSSTARSPA